MAKKILVIDDETDILDAVTLILTHYGFTVEAIAHWQQVNPTIEAFIPDLILLDVTLSGADGRQICREIKTEAATAHIPVILFSASNNLLQPLPDCTPDAVIEKPFDALHLVNTIQDVLAV